jgi:flagellar biosynthesis protein FlhA
VDVGKQLFGKRRPLWVAGGVMLSLAAIPGLPKLSFVLVAAVMFMLARRIKEEPAAEKSVM